jgi:hypothetical protein
MNASAIDGFLFSRGRRTMSSGPAVGGWPWMDCLVHCLEMDYVKGDGCGSGGGNQGNTVGSESNDGIPVVLRCLLSVVSFAESKNVMTMGGGGGMVAWSGGGGCTSSLLQSLSQLGFLLIDCIKKGEPYDKASSLSSGGIATMGNDIAATQVTAVLAPRLDILSVGCVGHRNSTSLSLAPCTVVTIGRFLLRYLFCQSLSLSSRFSSSLLYSLSSASSHHDDLMRKLAELEVEDANDHECVPPSLTPVELTY